MEKKHKFAMLGAIIHIVNADWASLVGSLADMDIVRPGTNVSRITMVIKKKKECFIFGFKKIKKIMFL